MPWLVVTLLITTPDPGTEEALNPVIATPSPSPEILAVGIVLGEPTAVGVRYNFAPNLAGQAWIGGTLWHKGLFLAGDALFVLTDVVDIGRHFRLDVSGGGGVVVGTAAGLDGFHCHDAPWRFCHTYSDPSEAFIGLRLPLATSLNVSAHPFELFVEVAPGVSVLPNVGLTINGGLGVRYWL